MLNLRLLIKKSETVYVRGCRNKFDMTLQTATNHNQGVIPNLFRDLSESFKERFYQSSRCRNKFGMTLRTTITHIH